MTRIYRRAMGVHVWLSAAGDNSDLAMDVIDQPKCHCCQIKQRPWEESHRLPRSFVGAEGAAVEGINCALRKTLVGKMLGSPRSRCIRRSYCAVWEQNLR